MGTGNENRRLRLAWFAANDSPWRDSWWHTWCIDQYDRFSRSPESLENPAQIDVELEPPHPILGDRGDGVPELQGPPHGLRGAKVEG